MTFLNALKVTSSRGELLRHVDDDERVAQVRLVGAVVRASRPRNGMRGNASVTGLPSANSLKVSRITGSMVAEHVLLRDEAHLDVELVELARQPVGARVLVAEAGRDLEVAVEARHHDELLELLRRLRQRVELARMQARRHQEVARALRRGGGEDRRLELEEAAGSFMRPRSAVDDRAALHDVLVQLLAAQVEEAVGEPRLLRVVLVAEHRHRQLGRRAEHLDAR